MYNELETVSAQRVVVSGISAKRIVALGIVYVLSENVTVPVPSVCDMT
jgi:hypothetical protein